MTSILHKIEIERSPEEVFKALSDPASLTCWWTQAQADNPDQKIAFRFGPEGDHIVRMQVDEQLPDKKVVWQCIEGPWAETGNFVFDLEPIDCGTALRFAHHGWPAADDFFMHCNSKWGFFLVVSLKSYLETGTGQPHPADPAI